MAIDYQRFLDEAVLSCAIRIFTHVQNYGLTDDNHLYVSFKTNDILVKLSDRVRARYPEEITIVLQHQFDNLIVDNHGFSVGLSFNGIYEYIYVPFRALTSLVDQLAQFSLQFKNHKVFTNTSQVPQTNNTTTKAINVDNVLHTKGSNVVMLDNFRNKDLR